MTTRRIGYLTKGPPSSHGVGLYSQDFQAVLSHFGDVVRIGHLHESADSQSLRKATSTALRALRHGRRLDVLVVETSGRCFAEFFAALAFAARHPRTPVWLGVHDAPHLTGGVFWISLLDRRGLRRLAELLSRWPGRTLERWLLRRANAVWALSSEGADALARNYELPEGPHAIPHVVDVPATRPIRSGSERVVLIPGYTQKAAVEPVLELLARRKDFTLRLGVMPDADSHALQEWATRHQVADHVTFVGHLEGAAQLAAEFSRADIVVRLRPESDHATNPLASSAPIMAALASGCAVVTNDPRGTREHLLHAAAAAVVSTTAEALAALERLLDDEDLRNELGRRAWQSVVWTHQPDAVARALSAFPGVHSLTTTV